MGGSRGMGGLGGGMLHGAHPFSVAAWLVRRRRRRWRQGRRGRRGRQGVGRAKNACDRQPVPPVYSDSMDDDDGNMLHGAWWTVMRGTAARKSYAARLCWGGELTPGRVRRRQESRETGARRGWSQEWCGSARLGGSKPPHHDHLGDRVRTPQQCMSADTRQRSNALLALVKNRGCVCPDVSVR